MILSAIEAFFLAVSLFRSPFHTSYQVVEEEEKAHTHTEHHVRGVTQAHARFFDRISR